MTHLVLLGGPPGIGKSTTLTLLESRLSRTGFLDADDVWRLSTDMADERLREQAHEQVIAAARHFFRAGCSSVVLAWVFARQQLYRPLVDAFASDTCQVTQIYLTVSQAELARRLRVRFDARGREGDLGEQLAYARSRLDLINDLPYPKIDTTNLSPAAVADRLASAIREDAS